MNIGSTYALNGKIETEAMSVVMAQIAPKSAHTMEDVEFNTNQILSYMDKSAASTVLLPATGQDWLSPLTPSL